MRNPLKGNRLGRISSMLDSGHVDDAKRTVAGWVQLEQGFTERYVCNECGNVPRNTYMVHDEVWKEARMEPQGFLCLACLELRLGRNLVIEDFTAYPVNNDIRFGYLMGKRSSST